MKPTTKQHRISIEDDGAVGNANVVLGEPPGYDLYAQQSTSTQFHVWISREIGPPHQYTELLHLLRTATENDEFHLHINTRGGMLETGAQLLAALQHTEAHIFTYAEGAVYSLGSMLLLAGDTILVAPYSQVMCHVFSGGVEGSGHDMATELAATVDWFNRVARDVYVPFLSESELKEMMTGRTFWMLAPEVQERLERVAAHRREQVAAHELLGSGDDM